jgi:hypothetical protein
MSDRDHSLGTLLGGREGALDATLPPAAFVLGWLLSGNSIGAGAFAALGQRTRWRRDPDLLRVYGLASWIWVGQYTLRVLVFGGFWLGGWTVALGVAQIALTWPLVALCVALSALVLRRALPQEHPGFRHPRVAT